MTATLDLEAYFRRIGYDGPRDPTFDNLKSIQTRHLDSIPFESIDAALDRGIDISPEAVDAKLIAARRGGYCYEQNGLFKRVLTSLGFEVEGLMCRVEMGRKAGEPHAPRTHMALGVTLDGSLWLVDVGFGGMVPPAPLKLDDPAPQVTAHERWRLTPKRRSLLAEAETPDGWEPMYEVYQDPQLDVDYEPANWMTSTHPDSFFRKGLVAARVSPDARYALFGARLTIRRPGVPIERRTLDRDGLKRALGSIFGLDVEPDWAPLLDRAARDQ